MTTQPPTDAARVTQEDHRNPAQCELDEMPDAKLLENAEALRVKLQRMDYRGCYWDANILAKLVKLATRQQPEAGREGFPDVAPGHWDTPAGRDMALATLDDPRMAAERARMSDFALANEVFLSPGIVNLTRAKERIRWLSAQLVATQAATRLAVPTGVGREEVARAIARVQQRVGDWDALQGHEPRDRFAAYGENLRHDAMSLAVAAAALLSHAEAGGVEVPSGWSQGREQGQAEGFAAAVQWLRDQSAMKPRAPLWSAAETLADQMEQSWVAASPAAVAGGEA